MPTITAGLRGLQPYHPSTVSAIPPTTIDRTVSRDEESHGNESSDIKRSNQTRSLNREYRSKKEDIEKKHNTKKQEIESEYKQQRQRLEQEYEQKRRAMGISLYA